METYMNSKYYEFLRVFIYALHQTLVLAQLYSINSFPRFIHEFMTCSGLLGTLSPYVF